MEATDIFLRANLLGFIAPIISGVICLIVTGIYLTQNCRSKERSTERKLAWLLIAQLTIYMFSWLGLIIYTLDHSLYMDVETVLWICPLYGNVLMFHFLFILTQTGKREGFNPIHYIIPAVLVSLLIWTQFISNDIRLHMIEAPVKDVPPGHGIYAFVTIFSRWIFLVYNILYSLLGLRRIVFFKRSLSDYSADEGRSSVEWLRLLIFVTLSTVPFAVIFVLFGINQITTSTIMLLPALLIILKDVILTYNLVVQNYVIIELPEETEIGDDTSANGLSKEQVDRYMATYKPFLDPKFRIVSLAQELCTNRTSLSNFINREYGMNFSRYINSLRMKELETLRLNPQYKCMSGLELVEKVGFSSFRGYLRAKRIENEESTLKE